MDQNDKFIALQQQINQLITKIDKLKTQEVNTFSNVYISPGDVFPKGDAVGSWRRHIVFNSTYNFDSGGVPAGFLWAGAPFATPSPINVSNSCLWMASSALAGGKAFLYQTSISNQFYGRFSFQTATDAFATGLRNDDGSDNNFAEHLLAYQLSTNDWILQRRSRTGGGAITTVALKTISPIVPVVLSGAAEGTLWSNWSFRPLLYGEFGHALWLASTGLGFAWTPTRQGMVFYTAGSNVSYEYLAVDAYG